MTDPITIGSAGVKFIFSADTVGKSFSNTYASTGTSVVYTVPAAKVFWVLHCSMSAGSDWATLDGSILANGVKICSICAASAEGNSNSFSMDVMVKITAGQTIQFYRSYANGQSKFGMAVAGIETSA